jgi:5'-deoxynucleotidase YfbR-like HD superfamily hydrolase
MLLAPQSVWKAALLHDAAEAYLGDVVTPLKNILGAQYRELEARFMSTICMKYRISQWDLDQVKAADKDALLREDLHVRKLNRPDELEDMILANLFKKYPEFKEKFLPNQNNWEKIVFTELLKNG